jgi:hypothetical protein
LALWDKAEQLNKPADTFNGNGQFRGNQWPLSSSNLEEVGQAEKHFDEEEK